MTPPLSALGLAGVLCALALQSPASAQDRPAIEPKAFADGGVTPTPADRAEPVIDEQAPAPAPGAFDAAPASTPSALSGAELDGLAGGDAGVAIAVSNQNLQAVNTGNRVIADSVVTGSVTLDRSAFSNFSGLGNIVVNTGNNNNLQSSLSVSVVMPPR